MSVLTKEQSIQESRPYELFRFVYGPRPEDIATYTTKLTPVTYNTETYMPLPVDREAITVSQSLDNAVLGVNLPHDSVIAEQYRLYPPVVPVTVTIFRGQEGEATPMPIWVGRVIWGDFQDDLSIRLECEPITTGFRRLGLHLHYQHICPHVLYDGKTCKADKPPNTLTRHVHEVSGNQVTITGRYGDMLIVNGSPFRLEGGTIEWDVGGAKHLRTVYRKENVNTSDGTPATRVTLIGTAEGVLSSGDIIEVVRGCSRTLTECVNAFNNAINFGGFPFIPTENPTSTARVFY